MHQTSTLYLPDIPSMRSGRQYIQHPGNGPVVTRRVIMPVLNQEDESMADNQEQQSYGMKAVGLDFNPSGDVRVKNLKEAAAKFIDQCAELRDHTDDPEVRRMASVAITEAQTAQMWSVKAATWGK